MKKITCVLLVSIMLCMLSGFTNPNDNEQVMTSNTPGVVEVTGDGEYAFGDGTIVTVEPIPWLTDEDEPITEDNSMVRAEPQLNMASCDAETVVIEVEGDGEYDMGNGMTLIVEPIPDGEVAISPRLHESNSSLPLTSEWTWFCDDEPLLETNLKIYNNSKSNPGNLNAKVTLIYWPLEYVVKGIEPGHMATIEGIQTQVTTYDVYLSASVKGHYKVLVTDWP